MCIHCVRLLTRDELLLWSLSGYSGTYLDFLFMLGTPEGRRCIRGLTSVLPPEVYPVTDTSTRSTGASQ